MQLSLGLNQQKSNLKTLSFLGHSPSFRDRFRLRPMGRFHFRPLIHLLLCPLGRFHLRPLATSTSGIWPLPPQASGPLPPQASGPLPPQVSGPFPPQASGPLPPQASGPLPPQASGPLPPQASGPLPPQASGPLPPQASGPLPPQASGPLPPQASGPLPPQASGPLPPQASGPLPPQASGPLPPQASGPFQPQPSGPFPPQASGPFQPQPSGPFPPQASGPFQPQPSGPFQPQPSGPFPPQPSGPFPPQPSGPFPPQPSGPFPPQPSGPFPPQPSGPFPPQPSGPFPPQPPRYDPLLQVATSNKCEMSDSDKVTCGEPGIDAFHCGAINCCFDGQQCYYGKTVTVQCTIDGQFVLVVSRDTTLPRISLDSISLLGGSDGPCAVVDYNADFAIYQFPVTACGTTAMVFADYVVYENKMVSSYEVAVGPLGAITRDSHYELYFQCRYSATSVESLAVALSSNDPPLPLMASGPLRVELRLGNGQCVTKGCVEEQVAYTSYYAENDYPVTKVLREPVYVEVRMLGRTDPNLVLVLGHCWATSTPDRDSVPQWDLLVNGCPNKDDRYLTTLVPVDGSSGLQYPSHYKRFVLKMFTFVDRSMNPLKETIYIHCSTAVCSPTAGAACEQKCDRRRRDVGSVAWKSEPESVVSSGEVIYTQTAQLQQD
uniref:Zona pellucida sperm-binding protein 4 n=1 Tax=Astyanax mexicanus TaxID=7994 RepID=A0A3B1J5E7_ASTMX